MFINIKSACTEGIRCIPVHVEVSATTGLPQETIIGLPDTVIKESRSRIKSALQLAGFSLPAMSYVINLSPTDVMKRNTSLELAMCVALLHVTQQISANDSFCFIGSLSLDGRVLPTRHILSMIYHYPNWKKTTFIIPHDNISDIHPLHGLSYISISHLNDLRSIQSSPTLSIPVTPPKAPTISGSFDHIFGHDLIKKACAYSIIGQHPMLLIGSPGIGKTMLIEHMKTLSTPLDHSSAIENTCIETLLKSTFEYTNTPPFRSPHHSISYAGMLGGKNPPQPGEITRANHGILFLDELGEYHRSILDTLREPMESQTIQLSRAGHSISYPANFLLVAAMNPCYCGHYFDLRHPCQCTPIKIKHYWQKISQPLLDRISICSILSKPSKHQSSITHTELKELVATGKKIATQRNPNGCSNQFLREQDLLSIASIDSDANQLLQRFFDHHHVSLRGQSRLTKLCRTIADSLASPSIKKTHALTAIQLTQHHQLPI